MIKKTFKELNKFNSTIAELVKKHPEVLETKLGYAIKRFEEVNLNKIFKDYSTQLALVRIENALTDKTTGAVLRDETSARGFLFDKEGFKAVFQEEQKIEKTWEDKEFNVDPFICKKENLPKYINESQIEVFKGLVL